MSDPAAVPPPVEKAGAFEDFVDIFFSPAKVFARRAAASPAMPYFVVVILLVAMYFVNRNAMAAIIDAEITKGMEAGMKSNPNVTPEQMQQGKAMMMKFGSIGAIVFVPIALLVLGLVTWIVNKILGGAASFGTALLVASFAWFPRVLESVLTSVQALLLDTSTMTSRFQIQIGPARFLDPVKTPVWEMQILGRLDVFTIWVTILLAIGLVQAGKVPKNKQVIAGLVMWLIGSLPAIYAAIKG